MEKNIIKSTTIVGIRKDNLVVIAGDGQASPVSYTHLRAHET